MNKAKNEPGHIPKTFLPTTLPIPEFEDDNIFSKTPSAMMSPIHSEKSPKPGMDKTPKGRFIELTTPTPIKPGSKEREHENPKLSISINFRPMAGSTMPGSPML